MQRLCLICLIGACTVVTNPAQFERLDGGATDGSASDTSDDAQDAAPSDAGEGSDAGEDSGVAPSCTADDECPAERPFCEELDDGPARCVECFGVLGAEPECPEGMHCNVDVGECRDNLRNGGCEGCEDDCVSVEEDGVDEEVCCDSDQDSTLSCDSICHVGDVPPACDCDDDDDGFLAEFPQCDEQRHGETADCSDGDRNIRPLGDLACDRVSGNLEICPDPLVSALAGATFSPGVFGGRSAIHRFDSRPQPPPEGNPINVFADHTRNRPGAWGIAALGADGNYAYATTSYDEWTLDPISMRPLTELIPAAAGLTVSNLVVREVADELRFGMVAGRSFFSGPVDVDVLTRTGAEATGPLAIGDLQAWATEGGGVHVLAGGVDNGPHLGSLSSIGQLATSGNWVAASSSRMGIGLMQITADGDPVELMLANDAVTGTEPLYLFADPDSVSGSVTGIFADSDANQYAFVAGEEPTPTVVPLGFLSGRDFAAADLGDGDRFLHLGVEGSLLTLHVLTISTPSVERFELWSLAGESLSNVTVSTADYPHGDVTTAELLIAANSDSGTRGQTLLQSIRLCIPAEGTK